MDPRRRSPHLLIDPALPDSISSVLRAGPQALRAARLGQVPRAWIPDPVKALAIAGLMLLMMWLSSTGGFLAALILIFIAALRGLSDDPRSLRERRRVRLAVEHGDRFILPEDLDADCGDLLRRAQDATKTVLDSWINRAGLLDTIDNMVTLPAQTWQIATRLVRLSKLRAEHHRLVPDAPPPEVAEAFTPYVGAMKAAESSLTRRIRALEEYARQVHRADGLYLAHRQLQVLAERTPQYEALVAETAEDAPAIPDLERLTEQARQIGELFHRSIDEARDAARHLLTATDS
ncbi:hypothetical protein [Streptosporangium amethystogenes]|uniref:hypothetical protein n=1 Tax=Streptosporangium amethystogenes TaxID=2002 RepID=UPI0006895EC3|nr:hypothetical protein [Streptosporangium amethystogenes]